MRKFLLATAAAFTLAGPAAATTIRVWNSPGDRVLIEQDEKFCSLLFDTSTSTGGLVLLNRAPPDTDSVRLQVAFNGGHWLAGDIIVTVDGVGFATPELKIQANGVVVGGDLSTHSDLLHAMFNGKTMIVSVGTSVVTASLAGSAKGIALLDGCQHALPAAQPALAPQPVPVASAPANAQPTPGVVRVWTEPTAPIQVNQFPDACTLSFKHETGGHIWFSRSTMFDHSVQMGVEFTAKTWPKGTYKATLIVNAKTYTADLFNNGVPNTLTGDISISSDFINNVQVGRSSLGVLIGDMMVTADLPGSATAFAQLDACRNALSQPTPQPVPVAAMPGVGPTIIPMQTASSGNYRLQASINGSRPILFMLDTGASVTTISRQLAKELEQAGQLSITDYQGSAKFTLANGTVEEGAVYQVASFTIGGMTVHDVLITVGGDNESLLLGQSVLRKFKSWSIDNEAGTLRLDSMRIEPQS